MSGTHFEGMAATYADARPPYPPGLFVLLRDHGVIGSGLRVLEVGAGAGLATVDLVRSGSTVLAVEPGTQLAVHLRLAVPSASILPGRLEDVTLPDATLHSVVAATSMHWVDLPTALPKLHRALRPGGWLAVWRHLFSDESAQSAFRDRVRQIVQARGGAAPAVAGAGRPTMEDLSAGGWFTPVRSATWRWSIELDSEQVRRLFSTFSGWSPAEVAAAATSVDELGGVVHEHYRTVLHLLRRSARTG